MKTPPSDIHIFAKRSFMKGTHANGSYCKEYANQAREYSFSPLLECHLGIPGQLHHALMAEFRYLDSP